MRLLTLAILLLVLAPATVAQAPSTVTVTRTTVRLWIPAVAQGDDGSLFGVAAELEVVRQAPGSGLIFLSTEPLTQIDMQGSARLAVQTAAAITGRRADDSDYFFTVRTGSVTVGGPSAGGAMAVAAVALLQGWPVRSDVVMTGMINPDGSIGPIGGVPQKLEAADGVGASVFLVPLGQSVVARSDGSRLDLREEGRQRYGIEVREVSDLYDAVEPFTGYRLVRAHPTKDLLKDEAYTNITRTLAGNLTREASRRADEVASRLAAVEGEMGSSDRSIAVEQVALARNRSQSSQQAVGAAQYYLASSRAFQGLVAAGYAAALIAFYEVDGPASTYVTDYLEETSRRIRSVDAEINLSFPYPASRLDAQAAAEQRSLDADALQRQARAALAQGNRGAALQASSFARERAESARWWFAIGDLVSGATFTPLVGEEAVETLYASYGEAARLQLEYANLVVGDPAAFQGARQALDDSLRAHQAGRKAAALFETIDAVARTSAALVAVGGEEIVQQRLARLSSDAAYQIELAQGQGTPPVYALSLFELANATSGQDPVEAYASYSLARLVARTSLQAAGIQAPQPGVERIGPGIPFFGESSLPEWVWAGLAASLLASVFLVGSWVGAAAAKPDKGPKTPPPAVRPAPTPTLVYRPRPLKARPRGPARTRTSKRPPR